MYFRVRKSSSECICSLASCSFKVKHLCLPGIALNPFAPDKGVTPDGFLYCGCVVDGESRRDV